MLVKWKDDERKINIYRMYHYTSPILNLWQKSWKSIACSSSRSKRETAKLPCSFFSHSNQRSGVHLTVLDGWNFGFESVLVYVFLFQCISWQGTISQWERMYKVGKCPRAVSQELFQGSLAPAQHEFGSYFCVWWGAPRWHLHAPFDLSTVQWISALPCPWGSTADASAPRPSKLLSALLPSASPWDSVQMPTAQQSGGLLGGARTWFFSNVRNIFIGELFTFICLTPGMCLRNKSHHNHAIHYYLGLLGSGVQSSQSR